jgi:hypothetical protein
MKRSESDERDTRDLVIQTWTKLDRRPATEIILREIQRALARRFGARAVPSPASIARVLADDGAELQHPQVIEFDARWRQSNLKKSAAKFIEQHPVEPRTFTTAETALRRFEKLRQELSNKNDADELRQLREEALNEKARALLLSRDDSLSESVRKVQEEIAEWFRVWLQTPDLFRDWLDLRHRSREFRETFSGQKPTRGSSASR